MKRRFTVEQIAWVLRESEAGIQVKEICRKYGIYDATFCTWREKFGGMDSQGIWWLKQLERANAKLKRLLAESILDSATPLSSEKAERFCYGGPVDRVG